MVPGLELRPVVEMDLPGVTTVIPGNCFVWLHGRRGRAALWLLRERRERHVGQVDLDGVVRH